jgi:hypothetical protein
MKEIMVFCIIASIFISCSSSKYVAKYNGDNVEITTISGTQITAELIALSNDEIILFFKKNQYEFGQLLSIKNIAVKSIVVKGYSDKSWKSTVLMTQFMPAAIIGVSAAVYSESLKGLGIGTILLIPGVLTYIIYDSSSPEPPQWSNDLPIAQINKFRIYARMPEGITAEQLSELIKFYKVSKVTEIK